MRKIFPSIFLLFPIGPILLVFVSCEPVVAVQTMPTASTTAFDVSILTSGPDCEWTCPSDSMTITAEMKPTLDTMLTISPVCVWPCPSDSMTLTV